MFDNVATPPWYRDPAHSNKPKPFHYSKLRREEDILKARKKRRRQWMIKAYLLSTTGATTLTAGAKTNTSDTYGGPKDGDYRYGSDEKGDFDARFAADAKNTPDGRTITNNYRQLIIKQPLDAPVSESKYDEKSSTMTGIDRMRASAADFKRNFPGQDGDHHRSMASASLQLSSRGLLNMSESLLQSKVSNAQYGYGGNNSNHHQSTAQQLLRSSYGLDEQSVSTMGSRVKNNTVSNAQITHSGSLQLLNNTANAATGARRTSQPAPHSRPPPKQIYDPAADQYVDLVDWR